MERIEGRGSKDKEGESVHPAAAGEALDAAKGEALAVEFLKGLHGRIPHAAGCASNDCCFARLAVKSGHREERAARKGGRVNGMVTRGSTYGCTGERS